MTLQAIAHAQEVRERLRNPQNAVVDDGIDLKRKPPVIVTKPEATLVPVQIAPKPLSADLAFVASRIATMADQIKCISEDLAKLKKRHGEMLDDGVYRIQMKDIQTAVSEHYKVSVQDMVSGVRTTGIVFARHIAMYLCRKMTTRSLPEIGRMFNNRDHTTCRSAIIKIEGMRGENEGVDLEIKTIMSALTYVPKLA